MTNRWAAAWLLVVTGGIVTWSGREIRKNNESVRKFKAVTRATDPVEDLRLRLEWLRDTAGGVDLPVVDANPAPPREERTADVNVNDDGSIGDGVVDIDDILTVLDAYSAASCPYPCPADICCCGGHKLGIDDIYAALLAYSGETEICPVYDCECIDWVVVISPYACVGDVCLPIPVAANGKHYVEHGMRVEWHDEIRWINNG
jgi:hypothetical protein